MAGRTHLAPPARERGAVVIMTAGFMLLAAFCLALVVDTGRLYLEKRKLQRIADVAALEVASRGGCGDTPDGGMSALALATENAARNGFPVGGNNQLSASCGSLEAYAGKREFLVGGGVVPFGAAPCSGTMAGSSAKGDAIRVVVCHTVPASLIMGGVFAGRTVALRAEATSAQAEPVAVFRVGSGLIATNPSAPLMGLLTDVGVDTSGTNIASYQGLAGVKITPAGLLEKLGVPVSADMDIGALNQALVDADVTIADVLDAIVDVAGQGSLIGTNATLLSALSARLGAGLKANVLLQTVDEMGLAIQANSRDKLPGMDVGVDALQLLTTALELAAPGHALNLGIDILGSPVDARVIEAPAIGIGGVGTTAYTAQARVYADVDTNKGVLSGLLKTLGVRVHLPVIVDGVAAKGVITRFNCAADPRTVTIQVTSSVANACIGKIDSSVLWSDKTACTDGSLQDEDLVSIGLLGLKVRGQVAEQALPQGSTVTLPVGGVADTGINQLAVGTLISDLLDDVLGLLANSSTVQAGTLTAAQATDVAKQYATKSSGSYTTAELQAIRNQLDAAGFNWDRPLIGLLTQGLHEEWYGEVGCLLCNKTAATVRQKLADALQKPEQCGLVGCIVKTLVDVVIGPLIKAVSPLLKAVLTPLLALLDDIGSLLSDLLADTLGPKLGETKVFVDDIQCSGGPRLVI